MNSEEEDEDAKCEAQFKQSIAIKKPSSKKRILTELDHHDTDDDQKVKQPVNLIQKPKVKLIQKPKMLKKDVKEEADDSEEGAAAEADPKTGEKYSRLILFVGQIPFEATEQDVAKHFLDHGAGKVTVRLLTDKETKKSKGLAFVDFTSPQQLVCGLRCHRTRLNGRAINVERTVGGGGNNVNRKEKLVQLREAQGSKVKKQVEVLVKQAIEESHGNLTAADLDDLVVKSLCSLPRDAAKQVLDEVLNSDLSVAKNKKAWVLGFVKRYVSKLKEGEQFLTLQEEKAGIVEKRKQEQLAEQQNKKKAFPRQQKANSGIAAPSNNRAERRKSSSLPPVKDRFKRGRIGT